MTRNRKIIGRTLAAAAALAAASLALAGPASADGTAPTPTAATPDNSQAQVAPLVQPSVVYETMTWSGYVYDRYNKQYLRDKPFSVTMQCTGFVVNPDGYIATAGHCVDPAGGKDSLQRAAAEWALENYYTNSYFLTVDDVIADYRIDTLNENGQVHHNDIDSVVKVSWGASVSGVNVLKQKPARVLSFQKFNEGDGALLKVDETELNAIELADTSGVEINSGVVAVGYPAVIGNYTDTDLTPTFDAGNVSSIKTVADGLLSVFQLSAELSGGMSGGPTVDAEGRVIGVNSSHFVGEPFNYAVPAERIKELMDSAGVDNEVSETTQTYREGIRAYFDGDRETAVSSLEKVLDEQPANGLAETYLGKAKELPVPPAEEKDSGSSGRLDRPRRRCRGRDRGRTHRADPPGPPGPEPQAGRRPAGHHPAGIPTAPVQGQPAAPYAQQAVPVPAGFAPAPAPQPRPPAPARRPLGHRRRRRGEGPGHHGVLHHLWPRAWTPAPTSAAPAAPGTSRAPDRPTPHRHRPGPRTGAVSPYPASRSRRRGTPPPRPVTTSVRPAPLPDEGQRPDGSHRERGPPRRCRAAPARRQRVRLGAAHHHRRPGRATGLPHRRHRGPPDRRRRGERDGAPRGRARAPTCSACSS